MRSWKKTGALLIAVVLVCTACKGSKDKEASTMSLEKFTGKVDVCNDDGKNLEAEEQLMLYSGYQMDTKKESYAWINLDHVKLTKMDERSEIEIRKNGKKLEIIVNSGKLFFNITEPLESDETLDIRTSNMIVGIRGTCGWVESGRDSAIYVLEGTVECADENGNTEKISAGQKAFVAEEITVEEMELSDIPDFVRQEERPADSFGGNVRFISWADSGLEDHVMDWKDTSLEEEMRSATDIYEGDIMLSDVWELTELDFLFNYIEDISALSELKNLTSLNFRNNRLTDISPLAELPNLTNLDLGWNKITDISPLKNLTNLMVLELRDNYDLTDISALGNLTNLTSLGLSGDHDIGDISALASLTKMTELDVSNTGITNIDALSDMVNMVSLDLSFNKITDISPLKNMVNLRDLQMAFTDVTDYSPLDNLPYVDRRYYH